MKRTEFKKLREELQCLKAKHRLAFAASCSNRVLPSYKAFQDDAKWGDYERLSNSVEYIWACLEGESLLTQEIERFLISAETAVPDLDEIESELASWGHDAGLVIIHTLECALTSSAEAAASAASWAYDTVDAFVQEKENFDPTDGYLEIRILNHPLIKRELKKQRDDIEFLQKHPNLTAALVMQLRYSWENEGKSNIDM